MKHIVKRRGHTETYDERKLYAAIYAACLSVRESADTAELIAEKVVGEVNNWIEQKHEVTSNDIRAVAARHLNTYHKDASYMYLHHRILW